MRVEQDVLSHCCRTPHDICAQWHCNVQLCVEPSAAADGKQNSSNICMFSAVFSCLTVMNIRLHVACLTDFSVKRTLTVCIRQGVWDLFYSLFWKHDLACSQHGETSRNHAFIATDLPSSTQLTRQKWQCFSSSFFASFPLLQAWKAAVLSQYIVHTCSIIFLPGKTVIQLQQLLHNT